jgi:hypothetical protein
MANPILEYFDLYSGIADKPAPVWPQYLVVAAAVFVEPMLRAYIDTGRWNVDWPAMKGRIVFALIVTLLILPGIYKGAFDPNKPVSIQLMSLFTVGLGWKSILDGIFKFGTQLAGVKPRAT